MDPAEQQSGPESDLNSNSLVAHQVYQTESDVDDDETIEFEIEVVSSNSSSKPGSLTDLRDDDDDDTKETAEVSPQLGSTSQSESPPPIVDIANQSAEPSSPASDESVTRANEAEGDQHEQIEPAELEYVLEIIADDDGPSLFDSQSADVATSNETTNNNCNNEFERDHSVGKQEAQQTTTCEELTKTEELQLTREEGQISIVEQDQAPTERVELEMKLKDEISPPAEALAETAPIKNDDLNEFPFSRTELSSDDTAVAAQHEQHFELLNTDTDTDTDTTVGQPAVVGTKRLVSIEPVGSKNIREIYKVLNSDSVLIVGCRPQIVTKAAAHEQLDEEAGEGEEEDENEEVRRTISQEQPAEQEATVGIPDDLAPSVSPAISEHPQSPEITIEHSPETTFAATFGRDFHGTSRRCSGAESEDLEWEFDHEPAFEERIVRVKQGKDPRDEYELGDELGRGRFGTVLRCIQRESGKQLAAKFVLTRRKDDREDVEREVEIMSLLQHKRLLQLFDAFDDGTNEMCLITELVEGGELFERIIDDDFDLTEKKAAIFMRQICEGAEYMHSLNIVHLDMKPENILCISRTGNRIKLIDFGLARQLNPSESLRVMFGTPDFAAPEVLCYDTVSLATDMWSVGVICYVLLSGLSPFMGNNDMETMANVTRATYDFDEAAFDPISDLAKDFISKLLLRDQTKRLKPNECLQHAWLARGGAKLEAAVHERRVSIAVESQFLDQFGDANPAIGDEAALVSSNTFSLDKRNLKKYVVRRKWHKTVHAIMALGRMGAKFKARLIG